MKPRVVLTGAGSGGHVTPVLAVAHRLKQLRPSIELIFIGQSGDDFASVAAADRTFDAVYSIRAGKFRRYHGEGFRQLLDLSTWFFNIRDFFFFLIGLIESWRLLRRLKPGVIFIKGGYVGVPIGLAAARLGVPYITHDSDAVPGLANRLIARWARVHAVALPAEVYDYPPDSTITTGVPVREEFKPVTKTSKSRYREELKLPPKAIVVLVVGGGLGSQRINRAVAEVMPHLLTQHKTLHLLHIAGRQNETATKSLYDNELEPSERGRVEVVGFIDNLEVYSGAADIVITRAGATNLAEFAAQGKACIVVPSPFLAGGHQLKNALYLEAQDAALVLSETDLINDPNRLAILVNDLIREPNYRLELAASLSKFSNPKATDELTQLILKEV